MFRMVLTLHSDCLLQTALTGLLPLRRIIFRVMYQFIV
jgi:hypothetical protein